MKRGLKECGRSRKGAQMERTTADAVNAYYEEFMFGNIRPKMPLDKIGFCNFGYWKGVEDSIELAQINLIETLTQFFTNRTGSVLDVACGKGASTRYLTKYFDPRRVTGINISETQLNVCKVLAPGCNFQLMDATQLDLPDASIENVLCIEAAMHFYTRARFFKEAHRVLKAGGRLAMSDFLCDYDAMERRIRREPLPEDLQNTLIAAFPRDNYLPDLHAYRESLLRAGFRYVRVEDSTELSYDAIAKYEIRRAEREFETTRDVSALDRATDTAYENRTCIAGCMVYAIK